MRVIGNSAWPTVKWLRSELEDVEGQDLAWGVRQEGVFGGGEKFYGCEQLLMVSVPNKPAIKATTSSATLIDWIARMLIPVAGVDFSPEFILGRTTNHTQGKDIKVLQINSHIGEPEWNPGFWDSDYWVKYEESIGEWRVHVFRTASGYRTIAVGKKMWDEETELAPPYKPFIRSRRNGWRMALDQPPPRGLRPVARAAVEALDYDFGAVDVLELEDGVFKVLEVNSAPGLRSPHTRARWLKAIKERLGTQ